MVSLLNYKTVDSELQQVAVSSDGYSQEMSANEQEQTLDCPKQTGDRFFAHVRRYDSRQTTNIFTNHQNRNIEQNDYASNTMIICDKEKQRSSGKLSPAPVSLEVKINQNNTNQQLVCQDQQVVTISKIQDEQSISTNVGRVDTKLDQHDGSTMNRLGNPNNNDSSDSLSEQNVCTTTSNDSRKPDFIVTWRNLNFIIEPKWHQKLANSTRFALNNRKPASKKVSDPSLSIDSVASTGGFGPSGQPSTSITRVVLDKLDGSFKSGELTAILGPSGAGKTTLLDCLTGHRKSGLSGSIKISKLNDLRACNPSRINKGQDPYREPKHLTCNNPTAHRIENQSETNSSFVIDAASSSIKSYNKNLNEKYASEKNNSHTSSTNNNLKVSIIPQNDHLIGHLTVYETLNYASKMKNCFYRNFDHKSNVKYVAQQLGLMSCLSTRINKLSGGQYKRVSIAQELLSSPDILILDEPTSGLDAMTCYQTVQVLRRLTDERKLSGRKQIAVILTIHQPNSDVFQQFNHVYVVAQGGKCIYEGPPSNVEITINRVGISLPSSFYNPATMIVEIAGGKFSQDIISKLNGIQKKQYEVSQTSDEQNSTSDSAVDCKSSSSTDDLDNDDRRRDDHEATGDTNNNIFKSPILKEQGFVNGGFVMNSNDNFKENNLKSQEKEVVNKLCNNIKDIQQHQQSVPSNAVLVKSSEIYLESDSNEGRRKKRRRNKNHSCGSQNNENRELKTLTETDLKALVCVGALMTGVGGSGGGGNGNNDCGSKDEKRIKLNSLKADQKFPFWRHTYLHFHRSWLSIVRDPMLCSMQLALHIIVPVMVSLVYGTNVGKPNACPRAGPVDIMAYALEPTDTALQLQEDLRTTLENIGYIFFKLYGIIFAAMTVTVLTFPLDMHVLVKEFRNGWYGLSSYFLGRTLADIPFQLTLPLLAMSLSYYATGQPYSYFQWRFLSITAILILSSLIAQSQGLLFGAILMDKMKAAVFVAPAATTPIILFAGFLVRTQSIPRYLRPLSNLSYLRYAIEACLISRYGFNQCDCDPVIFNHTVPELPPIARSMLDYWLSSFKPSADSSPSSLEETASLNATVGSNLTSSQIYSSNDNDQQSQPDLFTKLIDSLARANSFGRNITSCEQVVPYPMMDYDLHDSQLFSCFAILLTMLIFTRALTFFIVCFKVKQKV